MGEGGETPGARPKQADAKRNVGLRLMQDPEQDEIFAPEIM